MITSVLDAGKLDEWWTLAGKPERRATRCGYTGKLGFVALALSAKPK